MLLHPKIWILVAFGIVAAVFQPDYRPLAKEDHPSDRGTCKQIVWSVFLTQLAAIVEATYVRYPGSLQWDTVTSCALLAMALGLALRTWAVVTLGTFFTMHLTTQKDHTVVSSGPYRFVRHPSYLGAFVMYLSTTLFLHAWSTAIATGALLLLAFVRRVHHEERLLRNELGPAYESYRARVRGLLPGVW
ncbi:MAG: isoprenylcysteine carboxylmethyltransferase family protein [Planctomycetota bacterium]